MEYRAVLARETLVTVNLIIESVGANVVVVAVVFAVGHSFAKTAAVQRNSNNA